MSCDPEQHPTPAAGASAGVLTGPLSRGQQALWFLDRLAPGGTAYVVAGAALVPGRADVPALRRAVAALLARHPALCARFRDRGDGPVQEVPDPSSESAGPAESDVEVVAEDFAGGLADLQARLGEIAGRPFDLERGPLLRAAAVAWRGQGAWALALAVHHIAADFWSIGILLRELGALLTGRGLPPAPALLHLDWVLDQEDWLEGPEAERQWDSWQAALDGFPLVLELPADRPRPPARGSAGAGLPVRLGADLTQGIHRLAQGAGATPFAVLLGLFQAFLGRLSGQERLLVGVPTFGRGGFGRGPEALADVVGYFVNALPLPGDLSGDPTVAELLARAWRSTLDALASDGLPFALLAESLQPERDPSRPPVVQVMFSFQAGRSPAEEALAALTVGASGVPLEMGGLAAATLALPVTSSQFDLSLALAKWEGGLVGRWVFDTRLFEAATLARWSGHFQALLAAAAAEPRARVWELPLLGPAERHQLLVEWGRSAAVAPERLTLHGLVAAQAARTPDAVAVVCEGGVLSYGELVRRAGRLAARLRALGGGPETRVGLCAERSPELIVGLLAVLEAGGAYLPLDPSLPRERRAAMAADAGIFLLLAQPGLDEEMGVPGLPIVSLAPDAGGPAPGEGAKPRPPIAVLPDHPAYVLYTSGSTGRPKGVVVTHRSAAHRVAYAARADLAPGDLFLQKTSLGFDVSVLEIFGPLARGARTVLPRPGGQGDTAYLLQLIAEQGVTQVSFPPSTLAVLLADGRLAACRSLAAVITGGETVPGDLPARFHQRMAAAALLNRYGPTEATVSVTSWTCRRDDGSLRPPIGRLLGGAEAVLLDRHGEPVPAGVPGELCLGGVCLARGYWARPDLTAERFRPHPFAGTRAGGRLYHTGDLVRFRPDGALEFVGRVDRQVKVRGFRVELGEIEGALGALAGVREAAVVARPAAAGRRTDGGAAGDLQLAAFVVPRPGAEIAAAGLREALSERLPGYMVPAVFAVLQELPLTSTGKVDRRALAERELPRAGRGGGAGADGEEGPATATEERLAEIWEQLLGLGGEGGPADGSGEGPDGFRVGRRDHFFELGGHSLLAARLASRVREVMGIELPVRAVFDAPVLADLAGRIDAARAGTARPRLPSLGPAGRGAPLPLSFAQERLWVLDRLAPGQGERRNPSAAAYNMPGAVHLRGRLEVGALAVALAGVVARHEVLRTSYPALEGRPVQRIAPAGSSTSGEGESPLLPLVDLSDLPPALRPEEARRLEADEAARPFDLAAGPVLRCLAVRLGEDEHRLAVVVHHIAADGWSLGIFLREWTELYAAAVEGRPTRLGRLPFQYADFAAWQRRCLTAEVLAERLASWRERLAGAPTRLELPADRLRPAEASGRGGAVPVAVPAQTAERLAELARGEGATLFMALLAVFDVLLWRWSGQACVLVGTPVAGRERVELERAIGLFVETLVLRADLRPAVGFRELLAEARSRVLADQDRPAVPFGQLVEALAPREGRGRRPLVQVMLAFQQGSPGRVELPGVVAEVVPLDSGAAKLDLTLDLVRREDGGMSGVLEYDRDLFDPATAGRLAGHFGVLLAGVLEDPGARIEDLPVMTGAERRQLLEWGGSHGKGRGQSGAVRPLGEVLFQVGSETAAVVCQDRPAVASGELARRVESLARRLRRRGVGPEVVVGVLAERSMEQVVGLLAVLRAGGVYLPLDPGLPEARLAFLLADSGTAVVLAPAAEAGRVPPGRMAVVALDGEFPGEEEGAARAAGTFEAGGEAAEEATALDLVDDDQLAYLIYTSGSTGAPKGVGVSRRALAAHLEEIIAAYALTPSDRVLQFGSPSFDVALEQALGALAAGATLVLRGPELWAPSELAGRCAGLGITVADLPAAYWAQWVREHGDEPLSPDSKLRLVLAGGEAMPPDAVRRWARSPLGRVELVNAYGPTEAVITATTSRPALARHLETTPIGRPLAGRTAYVVGGGALDLQPCGVRGELCLGGPLARGYLGRPDLTAERFVPDPWSAVPGARLYRTGDLARFRPDGELEVRGRLDGQVKVRGFRVELGEIEAALLSLPGVREAAAVVRSGEDGGARLLAYVVPGEGPDPDPAALRAALRSRLPDFMVPAACVPVPGLPVTPAGKIDRRALAESGPLPARDLQPPSEAPSTPVEAALAEIWGEVLETSGLGVHDDFFDLGGNSLQATQVLLRIREAFGVELPVRTFFDHPTIGALALAVAEQLAAGLDGDQLADVLAEIG